MELPALISIILLSLGTGYLFIWLHNLTKYVKKLNDATSVLLENELKK